MSAARLRTDTVVDPWPQIRTLYAEEIEVIKQSLNAWSEVANITFVRTSAQDADIMFGQHRMPYKIKGYAGGLTLDLETETARADIWLENNSSCTTRGQRP